MIFSDVFRGLWSILGDFWRANGLINSINILDAFLDVKKRDRLIFLGPASGMRVRGGDTEGVWQRSGEGLDKFWSELWTQIYHAIPGGAAEALRAFRWAVVNVCVIVYWLVGLCIVI